MLDNLISAALFSALDMLYRIIVFCAPWGAFVATVSFVFWLQTDSNKNPHKATMWLFISVAMGAVTISAYFWFPPLFRLAFPSVQWAGFPEWHLYAHFGGIAGALFLFFFSARVISPRSNALLRKLTRKNEQERNQRTDVRQIEQYLPKGQKQFDASAYIPSDPIQEGVFIGLDEKGGALKIPYLTYKKSHVQIVGTTGFGKGVASTVLLAQSLRAGEAVFVLDPKNDEWAPHVLRQECQRAGVPFHFIDLNQDVPQLNFLKGMTTRQLEELFIAGFSLAERGEAADFYRVGDRKAAREVANQVSNAQTLFDLAKTDEARESAKYAVGFHSKFEELNRVLSVQAGDAGLDLNQVVKGGGCVYVVGSMRNARVILVQRMLMVRLIQLAEQRDRTQALRQVCIFLDEFKYHISRPALEGLGAARDKGVHVILAHQSLADLEDAPGDLNPRVVGGAVIENCSLRLAYRVQAPETAEWLAKMSGEILVDDEVRKVERNMALAEKFDPERTVRQATRYLIDVNMFLNLPQGVAVAFGVEKPKFVHIQPIQAQKSALEICAAIDPDKPVQNTLEKPLSLPAFDLSKTTEPEPQNTFELGTFSLDQLNQAKQPESATNGRN